MFEQGPTVMSDRTVVHDQAVSGPATHAVVIGCGAYDHLPGGSGPEMADGGGMAQLTSPPASATRVAEWLIENGLSSDKPLATVSLLLSEVPSTPFVNPITQVQHDVVVASAANVESAILNWADRSNHDVDARTIFYFCGHGLVAGVTTSLLLADFGGQNLNRFKQALDFDALVRGMESIKAAEQLFVVDSCRVADPRLLAGATSVGFAPLAQDARAPADRLRQPATLFSTVLGAKAFGFPGEPSVYTTAFIDALEGAGSIESEQDDQQWRVDTTMLKRAVDRILRRRAEAGSKTSPPQIPSSQVLSTFPIHDVVGLPRIPVFIRCADKSQNDTAVFSCTDGNGALVATRGAGQTEDWELKVTKGEYTFTANMPNPAEPRSKIRSVRPPFGDVSLEPT